MRVPSRVQRISVYQKEECTGRSVSGISYGDDPRARWEVVDMRSVESIDQEVARLYRMRIPVTADIAAAVAVAAASTLANDAGVLRIQ